MSQLMIYGAKALALGAYLAVRKLYPKCIAKGFVVKSLKNNPDTLAGLPVRELLDVQEKDIPILIATPEDTHREIVRDLKQHGFFHYTCMDSELEAKLMEAYFCDLKLFESLHFMPKGTERKTVRVYTAKSVKDRPLQNSYNFPDWIKPLWAGAALNGKKSQTDRDDTGENISEKNGNYCELTVLYWIWKNRIQEADYLGLCHYRRILDLTEEDLMRLEKNNIDAILPWPTIHEPDILEHHSRYVKESDWNAMRKALEELHPEYAKAFPEILAQPYFYNYNILIARQDVFENYCKWLFPILARTEELSSPKGCERTDRYIGYLGENLMTLYFMCHRKDLKIVHTGRTMLV